MLPILQRRFYALENSKGALVAQLVAIPEERRNERPGEGQWSAAELLSHIGKVEREILAVVQQNRRTADAAAVKLGDRFGSMIVRNVMRSPLRIKVPDGAQQTLPEDGTDAGRALADWDRVRAQWRNMLAHVRPAELKSGVFSHPKGGWFTLPETVLFLRLHHAHHRAQFARIARAIAATPKPLTA